MTEVFAVFDLKAGIYAHPFHSVNKETAIRAFVSAGQDANSQLAKNPEDFILFHIASFDEHSGVFQTMNPVNLGLMSAFLARS